jgi:SAM-dependent methyltransferase
MDDALAGLPGSGNATAAETYNDRLLTGGSFATRFSHRGRLSTATAVLNGRRFHRAADVGAADGTFLRSLLDRGSIEEGVGIDADPAMLTVGRDRSRGLPLRFLPPDDAELAASAGMFDLVVCMETLEHVGDPATVVQLVAGLAAPGATLLVSVPIELGPSLIGKQIGRWLANRRGAYGYESYRWSELARAGLLWKTEGMSRVNLHSHKGFDFRTVRRLLAAHASIEQTVYSPVRFLGPAVASTVFWIAKRNG